ncbi:MAG: GTPase ObgE [Clostridiales bacterium]|uniref:GTPase ObgE n=1 Tax=Provencibacterium massiliense TaxID=1841868 RepID=UPI0009A5AFF4|nr:GTPase ObgE [Provencibacterium massiliense]PWM37514.1 MAG: GTPase ObgE [Clostridiales bacterium]RGB68328.1 GTPase ObgE [Harryflintia acetispora]
MFVDIAKIRVKAGDGGNGAVTFHREKYVAAGGPDGGDGGRGGNVIFQVDTNLSTLVDFKFKKRYIAPSGQNGSGSRCYGKKGEDLLIKVPMGTLVREAESGRLLADMSDFEPKVIAKGGKGGWGNSHFATPTRQIPRFAKPGLPGEEFELILELKLLADVGLCGFPNVGKSTLLSMVSSAKPKIANYHFTTLSPILGVVRVGEGSSFVMADIPGLIEGAAEGVGLGHEFLRHIERCRLIVHVVDVSGVEGRDPKEDFEAINRELQGFSEELSKLRQIVAMNKTDIATGEQVEEFRQFITGQGYACFEVSAATGKGLQELMNAVWQELLTLPPIKQYEPDPAPVVDPGSLSGRRFEVKVEDGVYFVDAPWLSQVLGSVNMDDYESLQYFQRVLRDSGIIDRLIELGIKDGDTVSILDFEFDYVS